VELEKLGDSIIPPCPYIEELLYKEPGSDGIIGCTLMLVQVINQYFIKYKYSNNNKYDYL